MAFVVIYDACVLYPAPLRDLLVRVAQAGIVRARWTSDILDECFRSILGQRPELKPQALERTRELMTKAVTDCMVEGYEPLIAGLTLPDPDDRHVLAAAVRASAQAIVTFKVVGVAYGAGALTHVLLFMGYGLYKAGAIGNTGLLVHGAVIGFTPIILAALASRFFKPESLRPVPAQ